jgi:hypothetical protein
MMHYHSAYLRLNPPIIARRRSGGASDTAAADVSSRTAVTSPFWFDPRAFLAFQALYFLEHSVMALYRSKRPS